MTEGKSWFGKTVDIVKSSIPANGAQWIKEGCHAAGDGFGCFPWPVNLVGTGFEVAGCVAGCFDPRSSMKAELLEASIRVPVSAVPFSGLFKFAGAPIIKTGLKLGTQALVKDVPSLALQIHENIKNGKLLEMDTTEAMEELKQVLKTEKIDFDKLPTAQKIEKLQHFYEANSKANRHIVTDDSRERIPEAEFLKIGLAVKEPKEISSMSLKAKATEAYMEIKHKNPNQLNNDDVREILGIYREMRMEVEAHGTKVTDPQLITIHSTTKTIPVHRQQSATAPLPHLVKPTQSGAQL